MVLSFVFVAGHGTGMGMKIIGGDGCRGSTLAPASPN